MHIPRPVPGQDVELGRPLRDVARELASTIGVTNRDRDGFDARSDECEHDGSGGSSRAEHEHALPGSVEAGVALEESLEAADVGVVAGETVGTVLDINDPRRNHAFVGTASWKVIVDPTAQPNGEVIVYLALTNGTTANGGVLVKRFRKLVGQ